MHHLKSADELDGLGGGRHRRTGGTGLNRTTTSVMPRPMAAAAPAGA